MNKFRLLSYLFAALFLVTLFSCNNNDDNSVAPDKNQLLTAHPWKGDALYLNGYKVDNNSTALDISSFKVTFKDDRTYSATYDYNGSTQSEQGLWDLKENNTKMNFPFLNEPGELSDVTRLTENNFDVSTIFTLDDGTKQAVELRFVKQ
ncbi:hypothetical protein [Pontibacter chitinilyticus]|uniref:hypothetical protein n=1 Tax=Pontibacter chitinilyticus TaxID=2674989 RepID=UPI00321B1697